MLSLITKTWIRVLDAFKGFMTLNIINFAEMTKRENDEISWNVRRVSSLWNPSGTIWFGLGSLLYAGPSGIPAMTLFFIELNITLFCRIFLGECTGYVFGRGCSVMSTTRTYYHHWALELRWSRWSRLTVDGSTYIGCANSLFLFVNKCCSFS